MFRMNRIETPDWARPNETTFYEGISRADYEAIQEHRGELLKLVHQAVEEYVNDDDLMEDDPDDEDCFPNRSRMTGEYYISSESYKQEVGPSWYQIGVMVHCLEKPWHENQVDWDYLGLHVWVRCEEETFEFSLNGNTEQSVI